MEKKSKCLLPIVVVIMLGILVACQQYQLSQVKAQSIEIKTYVASGHSEWSPIMWHQADKIVGAGPQLVEKIMADLGLHVDIRYEGTWDEVQAKARTGEVDLLVAAYKTTDRELYMDYSIAYTIDPISLIVLKGKEFPYEKWEDLIGKKGLATVGDSYGQEFDQFIQDKLEVESVATPANALGLLAQNEADYFLYALYSSEKILKQPECQGCYKILEHSLAAENFYITISKKSDLTNYLPKINELIEKYTQDGTIESLINQNKK